MKRRDALRFYYEPDRVGLSSMFSPDGGDRACREVVVC